MNALCIRCVDSFAADELGYCGHCHWAVRVEIQHGLHDLEDYLQRWAGFADWCVRHGRSPSP